MTSIAEKLDASTVAVTNVSVTSLVQDENRATLSTQSQKMVMTSSQSAEYIHRLAEISSRATVGNPLETLFQQDKTGRTAMVTTELLYADAKRRTETKVAAGALVVEAGNFAAVAVWEPPSSIPAPLTGAQLQALADERPVFALFAHDIQIAVDECFGTPRAPFWRLSLMARDPERKDKGAVRAVIEPFVARAREEKVSLCLVAGNARARDVYQYFGFRIVTTIRSFPTERREGDAVVVTWFMVCNWPVA